MKNKNTVFKTPVFGFAIIVAIVFALSTMACSGGGKSINSADELKAYLDKQPANSPDKPIKVAMKANEMMIGNIRTVLRKADKYVSLDLSGSPLTTIPEDAFYVNDRYTGGGCETLVGVIIPNGVTSIGDNAFRECKSLTSVNIPKGVTTIGEYAFRECKSLTSVNIPNVVTTIGEHAFAYCSSLANITIPDGVTTIDRLTFYHCENLTSVIIGNSVEIIGLRAFEDCSSLTNVIIPASVTAIGEEAFDGCKNLTSVTFQGKPYLYRGAFYNFYGLYELYLHDIPGGTYTTTAPVSDSSEWTKK